MKSKHLFSFVTATVLASVMSFAQAHAKLEESEPKAASQLSAAPKEIRLQFNEALEAAFSKIKLVGAGNAEIALTRQEVSKDDPKVLSAVVPVLSAGEYHVQWSAMAHDGHKTKGEFAFSVK
ncbi:copper homeostasis periplasmic binding protein CopC [Undibacterium sp.]|uniref:copper homeostasis periplasmic binding protein CopC n=1 Tax=Undibacterium sp. TaxID=1914977 RepID=UPI00374C9B16